MTSTNSAPVRFMWAAGGHVLYDICCPYSLPLHIVHPSYGDAFSRVDTFTAVNNKRAGVKQTISNFFYIL